MMKLIIHMIIRYGITTILKALLIKIYNMLLNQIYIMLLSLLNKIYISEAKLRFPMLPVYMEKIKRKIL